MPRIWALQCYVSANGVDEIRAWYESQPANVRGKFLSRLRTLAHLPAHEWTMPLFRWLHGECAGLGEIRFKVQVQHRPLGFSGSGHTFTLTFCAEEKGGKFVPRDACGKALRRKVEINNDGKRAHACWLALG